MLGNIDKRTRVMMSPSLQKCVLGQRNRKFGHVRDFESLSTSGGLRFQGALRRYSDTRD